MSRKRVSILLGLVALVAAILLWPGPLPGDSTSRPRALSLSGPKGGEKAVPPHPTVQTTPMIGETILRDYAKPFGSPRNDLDLMAQLMNNFLLLVKSAATRPLSANEDWAAALCGRNPAKDRFLPDQHPALNS